MEKVLNYLDDHYDRHLAEFIQFLTFPSVSTQSTYRGDVRACANWLSAHLTKIGLPSTVSETAGHPVVWGQRCHQPGKPTVLIYGHYDVQPPEPLELWESPPFEPTINAGNIFARGATDDKGPVFTHIKAMEALLAIDGELPINVKWLFEGEEEIGSPSLEPFVKENLAQLACDFIVISDTAHYTKSKPSITYGLRGLACFELTICGPDRDLHSGGYGGTIANSINIMTQVLAKFQAADGRVLVPDFYNDVLPPADWEKAELARLEFSEEAFCQSVSAPALCGEPGYSTLERRWLRPTFDINGISGGYTSEGFKTVLPAQAHAKFSFRLVPNQNPAKIRQAVEAYLKELIPSTVAYKLKLKASGDSFPAVIDINNGSLKAARTAITHGHGIAPVLVRSGGSIPIVNVFQQLLGIDSILLGAGLPDDRSHSPNEKFDLDIFKRNTRTNAFLLKELARL